MEALPVEIIELILAACDPKVLAISIPQVSKLFKKLSQDDGNIWKAKCEQKNRDPNSKPSDQTWKQYYFPDCLKLFPFLGFILRKTTQQEILATPDTVAKKQNDTNYITYKSHNLWLFNGVFDMLYLTAGDDLPYEWIRQGVSWEISWVEVKELLRKKVGNYIVIDQPHQEFFGGDDCFTASITSAVKEVHGEDAIYYDLCFEFGYEKGDETTPRTLYKICIQGTDTDTLQYLYEEGLCTDK